MKVIELSRFQNTTLICIIIRLHLTKICKHIYGTYIFQEQTDWIQSSNRNILFYATCREEMKDEIKSALMKKRIRVSMNTDK